MALSERGAPTLRGVVRLLLVAGVVGVAGPSICVSAITANHLTSDSTASDQSSYVTSSISPGANRLILAWVVTRDDVVPPIPTASGNGLTWVQVATEIFSSISAPRRRITLLRAMGASPSTGSVTFTLSSTQNDAAWTIVEFDGVSTSGTHGSGAVVQPTTGRADLTSGNWAITLPSAIGVGNATAGGFTTGIAPPKLTPGAGYTGFPEVGAGGALRSEWRADGTTTVDVDISNPSTNVAGIALEIKAISYSISGTVFEDVNYGGGIGRDLATASADAPSFTVGRGNVTVELYSAAGGFVSSTTTAVADGAYSFVSLANAMYIVRVVNETVTSGRPGSDGSELGVQTYRADGDGEPVGAGAKKVGGERPSNEDAAANSGAQTLASLQGTDLDADGVTEWTQSIVTVDASVGEVTGVDFGFNFDVIVNTNYAGQGTLRQFILNSNLLH